MKRFFLISLLFFISLLAFSQITIDLDEAGKHVGDSVTVCGKVFSSRYLVEVENGPAFLNLGAAFPNQLLTVVIWSDIRSKFLNDPEKFYFNKEICITGRVELYREKPQIIIRQPAQITCKDCD